MKGLIQMKKLKCLVNLKYLRLGVPVLLLVIMGQTYGDDPCCGSAAPIACDKCPNGTHIFIAFTFPPDCAETIPSNSNISAKVGHTDLDANNNYYFHVLETTTQTGNSINMTTTCEVTSHAEIAVTVPNDNYNCDGSHTGVYKGIMYTSTPVACDASYPMCLTFVTCK